MVRAWSVFQASLSTVSTFAAQNWMVSGYLFFLDVYVVMVT